MPNMCLAWAYIYISYIHMCIHPMCSDIFCNIYSCIWCAYVWCEHTCAAYCIWSVISSFSNLNRGSSSPNLFYSVSLKRDQGYWDWRLRLNDTPNAIGCIFLHSYMVCLCLVWTYMYIHTSIYVCALICLVWGGYD